MSGMCLTIKGLRVVIKGSFALNSTRLARFCTAFATSFRVRDEDSEGLAVEEREGVGRMGGRERGRENGGGMVIIAEHGGKLTKELLSLMDT